MTYDGALWGALACALTALGAVLTFVAWRRRGMRALLRGTAWSLLPVAAWLTGTLRLAASILGDVARWATHLVFSPVVWLGVCLAGVSVVLFAVARVRPQRPRRRIAGAAGESALPMSGGTDSDDEITATLRKPGTS